MNTIIINGGNPLPGCPKDWDEARIIEEKLNKRRPSWIKDDELKWSFDCGFKLDMDGGLISISSRFYPPKTHYGEGWDGTVSLYFLDEKIHEREFKTETIDQLADQVHQHLTIMKLKFDQILKKVDFDDEEL